MMIKNIIYMNIKMIIIIINLILYVLYNNNKLLYAKLNKRLDYNQFLLVSKKYNNKFIHFNFYFINQLK